MQSAQLKEVHARFRSKSSIVNRMHALLGLVLIGSFAALISGCASTAIENESYLSHEIGKEATARVGTPMLIREEGTIEKKRRWVGILNSPDGWETIGTKYAEDYARKELIYQGSSGSAINVTYRVFRAGIAIPEQQENLTFDLSKSRTIRVKDFNIEVLKADGGEISYIVISY